MQNMLEFKDARDGKKIAVRPEAITSLKAGERSGETQIHTTGGQAYLVKMDYEEIWSLLH